jgi:hypothetical protein
MFGAFAFVRCSMFTPDQERSCREVVWFEGQGVAGWGCSECAWGFNSSGPPIGTTLEEMKRNYQMQLSEEFASHDCAEHLRVKAAASAGGTRPEIRRKHTQF